MTEFEIYLAKCRAESMKGKPLTREEKQGLLGMAIAALMLIALVVFSPK